MCGLVDGKASATPSADYPENYGQKVIGPAIALSKLAPVQRSSILLTSVERLSHREAAQVLDISEGELLRLLPQAREQLRLIVEAQFRQTLIKRPYLRRVK
jgi:RNA polymerase sigma-70 factor (ECF subfamily)